MGKELEGLAESPKVEIYLESLRTTLKRVTNWKTLGQQSRHGFGFKKLTSIHQRLALQLSRCVEETNIPELMTKGKITLIQRHIIPSNNRPITSLSTMWKIPTTQID